MNKWKERERKRESVSPAIVALTRYPVSRERGGASPFAVENAGRFYLCIYIRPLVLYRSGSELTDHTEYAFAVAFVSVGVVCQRNEQTRFVDITRKLDNSPPLRLKVRGALIAA